MNDLIRSIQVRALLRAVLWSFSELLRAFHACACVQELINSNVTAEKIGGIMAIEEVIDIDYEENASKITRLATYLRVGLSSPEPIVMHMAFNAGKIASCWD